jgi:DNA-binding transcriptional ArsR family regulator
MVNYSTTHVALDRVFGALANPTRRAIIAHLEREDGASVSDLARPSAIKLPAMLKHLDVLSDAGLISRAKVGRTVTVHLLPRRLRVATHWLARYEHFWAPRLDRLGAHAQAVERTLREEQR